MLGIVDIEVIFWVYREIGIRIDVGCVELVCRNCCGLRFWDFRVSLVVWFSKRLEGNLVFVMVFLL